MDDYDSEDDGPIVFKRSTNKNNSNPEVKKSSSQRPDGTQVKSNSQSSSIQKGKTTETSANKPNARPAISPPPVKNGKASDQQANNSSQPRAKPATSTPPVKNGKASDQQANNSSQPHAKPATSPPPVKNGKVSDQQVKNSSQPNAKPVRPVDKDSDSDDSDNKPINARRVAGPSKSNVNQNANKAPGPPLQKPKVLKKEDSDDEAVLSSKYEVKPNKGPGISSTSSPPPVQKPRFVKKEDSDDDATLSSKFSVKPNNTASTSKALDSDEKKPLPLKAQQNGPTNNQIKTSSSSLKRPIVEVKSSGQSSTKKPKLSNSPPPSNSKQVVIAKEESESDDDDDSDNDESDGGSDESDDNDDNDGSDESDESESDDDDDVPISKRLKTPAASNSKPSSSSVKQKATKVVPTSFKRTSQTSSKVIKSSSYSKSLKGPPGSGGEGKKWTTLVHSGVIFPPPYQPHGVKMLYKGKPVKLTPEQEEVATMFAVMLETDYMSKPKFRENFFDDWKKILGRNHVIQNLEDCNFTPIYEWHLAEKEKKKQMTTEEKKAIKEEKMKLEEKYMWAIVDGVKEKVGNFRVEPPGLFRGRGEHPKMGKFKKRIHPSDITINIGKDAPIPECPIPGQSWKEVKHDNTVTWLAFWNDPINSKEFKYVFLAASSSLKGQSDKDKYEKARKLKDYIQGIRASYTKDFASKDVTKKQIAVATYLIDKLALRAGNEKDDDEADTVGCCTLKFENVDPKPPNILEFDFLGKDSIRYQNSVEVEIPVYKAIQEFRKGKTDGDDLFDKLDTTKLNAHLKGLMPGLTAKVFRTYNASITLDDMLNKGTKGGDLAQKVEVYNKANKEVAIICNHQRTVSKSHSAQMTRLNDKIDELKGVLEELKTDLSRAKKGKPPTKSADGKPKRNMNPEALERKINQTNAKIVKMERDKETKEDLKTVALGTSKINYLDPRITVAWCKRHEVPMEKMFNKSLLAKFTWAMDVDPHFRF